MFMELDINIFVYLYMCGWYDTLAGGVDSANQFAISYGNSHRHVEIAHEYSDVYFIHIDKNFTYLPHTSRRVDILFSVCEESGNRGIRKLKI